jgi:hypothetical protein
LLALQDLTCCWYICFVVTAIKKCNCVVFCHAMKIGWSYMAAIFARMFECHWRLFFWLKDRRQPASKLRVGACD